MMNIWNKRDFAMSGLGERFKFWAKIKHFKKCLKWSKQRIVSGYAECDVWNMHGYLQELLPGMLTTLKNNRMGSPAFLEDDKSVDNCHAEWDKILEKMIFLWRESDEDTCTKKNPYDDEYTKAFDEFTDKYGVLGEKLQTEEELKENERRGGGGTVHFMSELPEYADISEKYMDEEEKLGEYREQCKDEAMDMMKKYFFSLWD